MMLYRNLRFFGVLCFCFASAEGQDVTDLDTLSDNNSQTIISESITPIISDTPGVSVPSIPLDAPVDVPDEKVHIDPPPPVTGGSAGQTVIGVAPPIREADPKNVGETFAESSAGFLSGLSSPIDLVGLETSYDSTTGLVSATGEVSVTYQGMDLRADRVSYHPETGEVTADGHVMLSKDGRVFLTDRASWNTKTGRIYTRDLRSDLSPFIYEAHEISTSEAIGATVETQAAYVTTHDVQNPNWHMKAKRLSVVPGDKVTLHDVTFYAGDTPIFWLPVYQQPLHEGAGYVPSPGFKSDWGAFMLNTYGIIHGDHTLAQYKFDLYQDRGVGMGVDLHSLRYRNQKDKVPFGNLRLYYINDWDPTADPSGVPRTTNIDPQRYRVNFQHRIYLPGSEDSKLYVDFDLNKLSDEFLYRDFYSSEYQLDPQPENQISLVKHFDYSEFSLWGRFQANKFFPTDTRLPEIALDSIRRPLGKTGLFYEGTTSLGIYEQELSRSEEERLARQLLREIDPDITGQLKSQLDGEGFRRLHTFHQLSYPKQIDGWLNLVPRVGVGLTYYDDIKGYKTDGSDARNFFHAGIDAGFKLSRVYEKVDVPNLGLKELRHIFHPYTNVSYLKTSELASGIIGIDPLVATTRPRPLDPSLHTAIEGLTSWNVVRLGILNTLETKRGEAATADWLTLNTYVDVFLNDPEFDRSISNLYNDLKWEPVKWLSVGILSQLPLQEDGFYEANSYIKWMPTPNLDISIGSLILQDHPFFDDSNRLFSSIYWQFADRWGVFARHSYEFQTGVLESQSYMLMHDFQTWTMGVGGQIRDSGTIGAEAEYSVLLMFTLKDFPKVSVPFQFNAPSGE